MTLQELNNFLEDRPHLECAIDHEHEQILLRNPGLLWYQNNPEGATAITFKKLEHMSSEDVLDAISRGLLVEQMTRVTGYYSKVGSWNNGKRAELKDRKRYAVE